MSQTKAMQQSLDQKVTRDQFRLETEAAWNHYKETGLHLTAEEVIAWLDTWGTESETKAPECLKCF